MASESRTTGFPEFVADMQSSEAVRRQLVDIPMAAAQQSVLGTAAALASLLGGLPDAFAASQRRELDRILKSGDDRDPRVAALRASIAQADVLCATAQLGQTRVERMVGALAGGGEAFHGFVSDSHLAPLEGLTVRLTETKAEAQKAFTARTEADGYFSIDLGGKPWTPRDGAAKGRPINMAERMGDLFGGASEGATPAAAENREAKFGQVEILKNDSVLYRDPVDVALNDGSTYREYVIPEITPSSSSGVRDGPSEPPNTPRRTTAQPTRATTQPRHGARVAQPKKRK